MMAHPRAESVGAQRDLWQGARAGLAEALYGHIEPLLGSGGFTQALRFGGFTLFACQLVSNVPFVLLAGHWVPKMADPRGGPVALSVAPLPAGAWRSMFLVAASGT
jgi:Na+/H+ antiporter NhaD/arsenite permease-like protein